MELERGTLEDNLTTVFPRQLCLAQHQALHRLFYFLPASAWFEIQLSLERV